MITKLLLHKLLLKIRESVDGKEIIPGKQLFKLGIRKQMPQNQ